MPSEFRMQRRVEFADTDMAGIVHFSNYFRFMEVTEHAFFESLGIVLHEHRNGHLAGWARVHASCDYLRPAHYRDLLEVHLTVREKKADALRYGCVIRRIDPETGVPERRELARGEMEVVYVRKAPGDERMRAHEMPEAVASRIEVAAQTG